MSDVIHYVGRHHIGLLALFIALGGTSYAAVTLPANSVGTKQIKKNAVTSAKIKKNAVTSAKVKNGSLRQADFAAGSLPTGPTGPQGARGPQGAGGPQGPKGDKGDQGDPFVPDISEESGTSANDSSTSKSTTVSCPSGTLAIGGYNIAADDADAPIAVATNREQFPAGVSQWVVSAHEATAYAGNWQIQVFVNCVG
jgi:hypothetical protein